MTARLPCALLAAAGLLAAATPGLATPADLMGSDASRPEFPRQGRFVKVGQAQVGGAQGIGYYRLPDGDARKGQVVDVWMPMMFANGAPSDTPRVGYSAYLMGIDCGAKTSVTRVALSYTREGAELSREPVGDDWEPIEPDSVMDSVRLVVCENDKPAFPVVDGFDAMWADAEREKRIFGTSK